MSRFAIIIFMAMISVLSLNMMHGRRGVPILATPRGSRDRVKTTLTEIAELIRSKAPDVVALQEVDRRAWLSGYVDQVEYLRRQTRYPHVFFGGHTEGKSVHYGTAILSRHPIVEAVSHVFGKTFPVPRKGFVLARIALPGAREVAVASVHTTVLNFFERETRTKQATLLAECVRHLDIPFILCGDFNAHFGSRRDRSLHHLMRELPIQAHEHTNDKLITHPPTRRRLDWIFPSHHFLVRDYRTIDADVSDHLPLWGVFELKRSEQ